MSELLLDGLFGGELVTPTVDVANAGGVVTTSVCFLLVVICTVDDVVDVSKAVVDSVETEGDKATDDWTVNDVVIAAVEPAIKCYQFGQKRFTIPYQSAMFTHNLS